MSTRFLLLFCLLALQELHGAAATDDVSSLPIGNFALPTSQQPGPLISFGENIIDKDQTQVFVYADDFYSRKKVTTDVFPSILYGITDDFSIFFNAPFTPFLKDTNPSPTQPTKRTSTNQKRQGRAQAKSSKASDPTHGSKTVRSHGWEDLFLQLEYAFFTKKSSTSSTQATVVANMTFPTGSRRRHPPTGFGAPSYFIGTTYNYTTAYWFAFTSYGAVFPNSRHRTKFGNQYLYQCGFGGNIPSPQKWIFAWMAEIDGEYDKKNKMHGKIDPNSGGNKIFLIPSLWASSERFLFQFGVGIPLTQHLFGEQHKFHYSIIANIGYTF